MRYLISFFFFSITLYGFNYHLKPYKISDGIHCFFGLTAKVSNTNGGNVINSCYIETLGAYVVIDSGPTYTYAKEAYSIMKQYKKLPIKYVINTSLDDVNILGNEFYREQGAKILAPKGYMKLIDSKTQPVLLETLDKEITFNTNMVIADEYINEKVLKFDDLNIEIKTLKSDSNHLYVYLKEKKILFSGNFIFNNQIPVIKSGRSINDWLQTIKKFENLEWSDHISSHGYMTYRSALVHTKHYLKLLKDKVLKEVNDDKSLESTVKKVKLESFSKNKFYSTYHSENVENTYKEYVEKKIKKAVHLVKASVKRQNINKPIKVHYKTFEAAIKAAKRKNKVVLVKVRSTICKYCDELDNAMLRSSKVKKLLNKYFELVRINMDYKDIPMGLTIRSTPTLIFIRPDNKQVLMKLAGIRGLGELSEILNEAVDDGHIGGYLKP